MERYFVSFLWSIAGFIVALPILESERISFFGWPLLVLSSLLLLLSIWQSFNKG